MSNWEKNFYPGLFLHKSLSVSLLPVSVAKWFCPSFLKAHIEELRRLWDLLLELTLEKGALLLRALKFQQYVQECADILEWIGDKVSNLKQQSQRASHSSVPGTP